MKMAYEICKSLTNLYTATFTKNTSYYNDEDILMG